jgi:hypothetical protein
VVFVLCVLGLAFRSPKKAMGFRNPYESTLFCFCALQSTHQLSIQEVRVIYVGLAFGSTKSNKVSLAFGSTVSVFVLSSTQPICFMRIDYDLYPQYFHM